jgi:hypothetical protein
LLRQEAPVNDRPIRVDTGSTESELDARRSLVDLFRSAPIPADELLSNVPLFLKRQDLTRILFLDELYRKIVGVHGVIMEFGVRWGRDMAILEALRGTYEPYNYTRRIVGFDTFEGFPSVDPKDGDGEITSVGAYGVTDNYEGYLRDVLRHQEGENPIPHIQTTHVVKGDASVTVPAYLEEHPETIVAFAYFDLDIYAPTRDCLAAIGPHLTKGSVIGFDELNHPEFPGETVALKETLGLDRFAIRRSPLGSYPAYLVVD